MQIIIDEYKREIQKLKMQISEMTEEAVRLRGFKQIVLDDPQKYAEKRMYKTKQEHANDMSYENETSETRETDERGDLDLSKQIEELKARVKSLTEINESHQKLNGDLRRDNKILADDNAILTDRLREAGM